MSTVKRTRTVLAWGLLGKRMNRALRYTFPSRREARHQCAIYNIGLVESRFRVVRVRVSVVVA